MAYLDPTMQAGILAQQGIVEPEPFTVDPTLQRDANIMGMLSNINRVTGGPGLDNPFTNQIAQQQAEHQMLQKARLQQLTKLNDPTANPFLEYETAKARGYFNLGEGEDDAAGFLRYTRERFAPKSKSVYEQKMGDLTQLMGGNEADATKLANGIFEVKNDPFGGVGVYDKSTGEFTTEYTPEQIAAGKSLIAGSEAQATGAAQTDWKVVQDVETNLATLADEWEASNAGVVRGREALKMLNEGEIEPNLVAGTILDYLGIGSSRLAYFSNLSQQQLFEELGNATLTPVSDRDIQALAKLFASAKQSPAVAKGNLESFLSRKEKEMERKSGRMRREINRVGDENYRSSLLETYQPFVEFKAITSWDDVPGGE